MRALVLGLAAVAAAPARGTEPAACQAVVELEPLRAFVGQQVTYRLRILRRADVADVRWIDPLDFRSLRAEWLPGRSPDPRISGIGAHRLVFEERRALFPARAGRLTTPRARMACVTEDGETSFQVPEAVLDVQALPEHGRPPGFAGIVGAVEVRASLTRRAVSLGESVPFTVTIWGPANVWRVPPPLGDPPELPGAEVFAHPPTSSLDAGDRLVVRRSFRFDLVPRKAGVLRVPALRVPYLDAAGGHYAVAETAALALTVRDAAPVAEDGELAPARADRLAPGGAGGRWRRVLAAGAVLLALGAVLARALWRRRPRRAPSREAELLGRAEVARSRGDPTGEADALAGALRSALERHGLAPRERATPELLTAHPLSAPVREAVDLLQALDAVRFAPAGGVTGRVDPEAVRQVLGRLA